jgi:hypothetical protein
MTTDFITTLTHGSIPLSKRWCADGTIEAFGNSKHFTGREVPVASFTEMAATLAALHAKPRSCVIRGRFTGQDIDHTVRQKDVFTDAPHHWLLIDVDKYQPLEADPVLEPVESIEQYIHEHLPPEFHQASYHWQLSNSAGHPTKQGLRAHLWFWSETPHSSATLRAWGEAFKVDRSLFDEIQIHYTAAPVFDDGVTDPVPVRHGTVHKASDVVPLAATPAAPSERATRQQVARETLSTDPVAQLLYEKALVKSERRNDQGLNIECPCAADHTGESGETTTIYYPANTGGYSQRAFKCLHSHCLERPQGEFLEALGYEEDLADDFDDISVQDGDPFTVREQSEKLNKPKFTPIHASQFAEERATSWLIKGVLPAALGAPVLAVMYGASGSGKSFKATDMAIAIARGIPWRGHRVTQGCVVYVCAEGAGGYRKRLKAYAKHHNIALEDIDVFVIAAAPNLLEANDVSALIRAIHPLGPVVLVVIDTLAQATAGGNENSGEDMGKAIGHCRTISEVLNCTVLLVHHSGKDDTKGARGHSSLKAAADTEFEVVRTEERRAMRLSKQKDGEDSLDMGFGLKIIDLGEDPDGDPITSCVVEHNEDTVADVRASKDDRAGPVEHAMLDVLDAGSGLTDDPRMLREELLEQTKERLEWDGQKRDQRRGRAVKALKNLLKKGVLEDQNGRIGRPK